MPRQLLVLEEVLAILKMVATPEKHIEAFRKQAEFVITKKSRKEFDNVTVASGYGQTSKRGFVELAIDDTLTQMDTKKAREVGLMILEASEAGQSDEMFMELLTKYDIMDVTRRGQLLLDLRELRQGTRGISNPS